MEQLQRQHREDILAPAVAAAKTAGVAHQSEIIVGNPAAVIAKRAEELGCDGIVMGTQATECDGQCRYGIRRPQGRPSDQLASHFGEVAGTAVQLRSSISVAFGCEAPPARGH